MRPIKLFAVAAVLVVIVVFVWIMFRPETGILADNLPESVSEAPSRTPRPTLTPLPTRVQGIVGQVTTAEELAGVWGYRRGTDFGLYYMFNQDGTLHMAATPTRERLEDSPSIIGEYWFEGSQLFFNITKSNMPEPCINVLGVYDVHLLENGNLRFVVVDDVCSWRTKQLSEHDVEPITLPD